MWFVAEFLLGFVVLATLAGFHVGPHSHLAAGIGGVLAAIWLLIMAATGQAAPLLWILLGADVALSAGVGTMAWKGIETSRLSAAPLSTTRILGAEGLAETDLNPEGIVKVRSESWSATSLNGLIKKGTRVQVIESSGVRLGVWGETDPPTQFSIEPADVAMGASEVPANTASSEGEPSADDEASNVKLPGRVPNDPMTGAS
jgi:membrane-bound ClpP family serine protease